MSLSWLDDALTCLDIIANTNSAYAGDMAEVSTRATLALWGPSQSGKSTLLSSYVDGTVNKETGRGGALDWGLPAMFSRTTESPENVLTLNPRNYGSDASGCVSRFVLVHEVPNPRFPIKMEFLNQRQILHMLALGFMSECRGGDAEKWTPESLANQLGEKYFVANGVPGRMASGQGPFALLRDALAVIDTLIDANYPRFRQLATDNTWERALRRQLLESGIAMASVEAAESLVATLLWDGHAAVTEMYRRLVHTLGDLAEIGRKFYCSIEAASVLLNAGACAVAMNSGASSVVSLRLLYTWRPWRESYRHPWSK